MEENVEDIFGFLATVDNVYGTTTDLLPKEKGDDGLDSIPIYNDNKTFADTDARMYGAITYRKQSSIKIDDYAFPFDKNNFTFPIKGETVIIVKLHKQSFYLPYTTTPYPNYRRDYITYQATKEEDVDVPSGKQGGGSMKNTADTGGTTNAPAPKKNNKNEYKKNEKIKFLKPNDGDTIISGRVGNTIRFSEFFLTDDGKTASPSIFIRNKQNPELDSKPIGELVTEDINKDGTSIYITSGKVKVPFKETIGKTKIGFKEYPASDKLKGDQLFINSDRIILSAKASEFIIFGKGNTGIITDGNFSIDAEKEIYLHNNKNITIHSKGSNQIFLNSDSGKVFLGKNTGVGQDGSDVQQMVLGGELVKILKDLISAILKQNYLTPSGPSKLGPENASDFQQISNQLKTILSANNYLSKT
jgi:hypothetical protein